MLKKYNKITLLALMLGGILFIMSCADVSDGSKENNSMVNEQESNSIEEQDSQPEENFDMEDDPQLNEDSNESEPRTNESNAEYEDEIDEDYSNVEALDAEEILTKSFDAMSDVTGLSMEINMDVEEIIDGVTVEENRLLNTEMLVQEPYSHHFNINIESNMDETIESEVYKLENTHYIYSSHDNTWRAFPIMDNSLQTENHLDTFISEATLEDHLSYSPQFEVTEDDDSYLLTFSGIYDEFISTVHAGTQLMLLEIGREYYDGIEYTENAFSITIQKETFYVTQYNISFGGKVPDDEGDYQYSEDTAVTLDAFNQVEEIIVPDDIVAEAVTMAGNNG